MVSVQRGAPPEAIRQGARHVLFVEGDNADSFDPSVLKVFLDDLPLDVKPFGPSHHIRAAAEALHPHHPHYYFLVDRDHHDDGVVEDYWRDFPNPATCNLLMWRRKELENYFVIPGYIVTSQYCTKTEDRIIEELVKCARRRIFLDIANDVIVFIRESLKQTWIQAFDSVTGFETYDRALQRLKGRSEFAKKRKGDARALTEQQIEKRFRERGDLFLGGDKVEFGKGNWLERMSGKSLFRTVVHACFEVTDRSGVKLTGREKEREVVKDLLRKPRARQPADFQELHRLISNCIR